MPDTKVAVLDDYQTVALGSTDWSVLGDDVHVDVFADHLADTGARGQRLESYQVVVAMRERTPFTRERLQRLPNLKLLITTGMRNASIDEAATSDAGVTLCGTGGLGYPTAELTWGLILALLREIPREDRATREGNWEVGTLSDDGQRWQPLTKAGDSVTFRQRLPDGRANS